MQDQGELSPREREILQRIIQTFIITANPVPSKAIYHTSGLNVSPATIRNTMNMLESRGFLDQIHTSSGRIPTEQGYRFYVNSLMNQSKLSKRERDVFDDFSETLQKTSDDHIFRTASLILSRLSNLLSVVIAPSYTSGLFRKMELIELSSNRLLVVITIDTGLIKTITIEIENPFTNRDLENISTLMNERFTGLKLSEISSNIKEVLSDIDIKEKTGIVRVFIESADDIFEDNQLRRFYFGGVEYMAMQPEFSDLKQYKSIIELVENDDLIVHLFDESSENSTTDVTVKIGSENKLQQIEKCSVVSANYTMGSSKGTIGLVGPTRMNYPKMVVLVEQLANRLNKQI